MVSNDLAHEMTDQVQELSSSSAKGLGGAGAVITDLTYCANNNRIVRVGAGGGFHLGVGSPCRRSRIAMVNVITKFQVSLLIILFVTLAGKVFFLL